MFVKISLLAAFGFILMGAVNPASASASESAGANGMAAVRLASVSCERPLPILSDTSRPLPGEETRIVVAEGDKEDSADSDSDNDSDSNDPDNDNQTADQDEQDRQDQMDQQNAGNQNQYGAQGYQPPDAGEVQQQSPFPQSVNPYVANPYQMNPDQAPPNPYQ
jgi:hypothetical protein